MDRERIIKEAIEIVDRDGEKSLTLRKLASQLDVTPMALYRYFDNRDAILTAAVEYVSRRITIPQPSGVPVDDAVRLALTLFEFLTHNPWVIPVIPNANYASPIGMRFTEGLVSCAMNAGMSHERAFTFYRTMLAAVWGQAAISVTWAQHSSTSARDTELPERLLHGANTVVNHFATQWHELNERITPDVIFQVIAETLNHPSEQ